MNLADKYMRCQQCKSEFTKSNYAITLNCGHNYCFNCVKKLNKQNFNCKLDKIIQDLPDCPSIDYMTLIDSIKCANILPAFKFAPQIIPDVPAQFSFYNYPSQNSSKTCRFFIQGRCRFGNKCWNRHM